MSRSIHNIVMELQSLAVHIDSTLQSAPNERQKVVDAAKYLEEHLEHSRRLNLLNAPPRDFVAPPPAAAASPWGVIDLWLVKIDADKAFGRLGAAVVAVWAILLFCFDSAVFASLQSFLEGTRSGPKLTVNGSSASPNTDPDLLAKKLVVGTSLAVAVRLLAFLVSSNDATVVYHLLSTLIITLRALGLVTLVLQEGVGLPSQLQQWLFNAKQGQNKKYAPLLPREPSRGSLTPSRFSTPVVGSVRKGSSQASSASGLITLPQPVQQSGAHSPRNE
jgi:hypothetical protein